MSAYEVTLRRSGDTFVLGSVATRGRQGEAGGGGGAVDSVNGETGDVVLDFADVGADEEGAAAAVAATAAAGDIAVAAAASSALSTHAADTTSIHGIADTAALATATDVAAAVTAHAAATDPHGDRAAASAALSSHEADTTNIHGIADTSALATTTGQTAAIAAAIAALSSVYQPIDSDLTAIAALSTTSFGRALLTLADAAAGRTALGLGTAATAASGDFQPVDSDLTAIAALTTTAYGRAFLALADAAAGRTALGLGSLATESTVTSALITDGTIVNGDINASAAIAYSKLNLATSIVNADISASAAIALSKLATDPLARANHTGTQTASTISDFASTGNALWAPINSGIRMPGIPRTNIPDTPGSVVSIGAANRAVYQRVDGAGTITKIGFNVGTSSGNVSAATCTGTAGRSVTVSRSGTSGAVACPASGYAEVTLGGSTAVTSNDWMAISCDNNTATFRRNSSGTFGIGTNLCLGFTGYENTAHPVPSTPTIVTDSVPPYTLIGVP